jgi:hypothetical protein
VAGRFHRKPLRLTEISRLGDVFKAGDQPRQALRDYPGLVNPPDNILLGIRSISRLFGASSYRSEPAVMTVTKRRFRMLTIERYTRALEGEALYRASAAPSVVT